jgi:hypothetical protein
MRAGPFGLAFAGGAQQPQVLRGEVGFEGAACVS